MKLTKAKYYLLPVGLCLIAILALPYYHIMTSFSTLSDTQYLYIDEDDNTDSLCSKLKPIASSRAMTGLSTLMRHDDYRTHIRTGRFAIEPGMSTLNVFRMLKRGQQSPMMLIVPEVRTLDRMAAVLGQKLMIDSTAIAQALQDSILTASLGFNSYTLPCLFIPNTYEVYWNISAERLLERMKREHDAFWNKERMRKADALGMTPDQVQTLASIVDEETANAAEKPRVAGLYLNRLRKGMLLQADPTVKFAVGDPAIRRILNKHLTVESPYNTYRVAGLPPGPIKVASVQGINAVLNAEQHEYIYMCAKEDFSGTHNFARTSAEHMQNARRYQQALNALNIKK